jgi:hypothetical protein
MDKNGNLGLCQRFVKLLIYFSLFKSLKIPRAGFPNLFDVTVPLTLLFISLSTSWGKCLFFKLIYFLIISYVRDKVVYCCWVAVYALINDVILFIYLFLFLHLAVPLGSVRSTPGYRGTLVGNHCPRVILPQTISQTGKSCFQLCSVPLICRVIIITLPIEGLLNTQTCYHSNKV